MLGISEDYVGAVPVSIAGRSQRVFRAPINHSFSDINILGMDFVNDFVANVSFDVEKSRAKIHFSEG